MTRLTRFTNIQHLNAYHLTDDVDVGSSNKLCGKSCKFKRHAKVDFERNVKFHRITYYFDSVNQMSDKGANYVI